MDTFYQFKQQIKEDLGSPLNSVPQQDAGNSGDPGDPGDANQMKYSNKSVGGVASKEDYFLNQLQMKAASLSPQQRFKILGDVVMTLYPEDNERQQYVQLLRTQSMQQGSPAVSTPSTPQPVAAPPTA